MECNKDDVETIIKKLNNNDYLFAPAVKVSKTKVFSIKCKQCLWSIPTDYRPQTVYCKKYNMYSYINQACKSGELKK